MNVATIFPLWPGNIGLLQAAVALPLVQYGVAYSTGFAYALVLQMLEMSVGVGVGLHLPGARGALVRDAARAARGDGAGRGGRRTATGRAACARWRVRLASRTSSTLPLPLPRWAKGFGEAARPPSSCRSQTAARGRRQSCTRRSAASGARRTCATPSAARARRAGCSCRTVTAVVEAAAAIPLDPARLDPLAASSRGFGELVLAALAERPRSLLLCLGGTATMDAGAGLLEVVRELPVPARVACDVRATAPRGAAALRPAEGRRSRRGARARAPVRRPGRACVVSTQARLRRRGWARRGARLARREPRAGRAARPRQRRLRPVGLRPRRHRRGPRRRHDLRLARRPARSCAEPPARGVSIFGGVVEEPLAGVETRRALGRPGAGACRPGGARTRLSVGTTLSL